MGCLGLIIAVAGLLGFHYEIWWLFYIAGGLSAISDIFAIITGELRCFGTLATIASWTVCYRFTGSIIDGVVLGSCISSIVLVVSTFAFLVVTAGIGAAFSAISHFFGNND